MYRPTGHGSKGKCNLQVGVGGGDTIAFRSSSAVLWALGYTPITLRVTAARWGGGAERRVNYNYREPAAIVLQIQAQHTHTQIHTRTDRGWDRPARQPACLPAPLPAAHSPPRVPGPGVVVGGDSCLEDRRHGLSLSSQASLLSPLHFRAEP